MERSDLRELVESPQERLDVEYKRWLDLTDKSVKAKVARHLCALANYGGGYLVFGIDDDMTPSGARPAGPYDQDTLSGIVRRYLTPPFQVTVHEVSSSSGVVHPVVWVPPHGEVPVCSKRTGPDDSRKDVGISAYTHYTRTVGPASEPVATPEMWRPIIRRCVQHDRQALLAALDGVLRSPGPVVDTEARLRRWHDAARKSFLTAAEDDPDGGVLQRAHYQLSYRIAGAAEQLDMAGFVDELRRMGHEVRQLVDSGWSTFVLLDVPALRPHSTSDEAAAVEEFLECRMVGTSRETFIPTFWRVAPEGMATVVRAYYFEDFVERPPTHRLAPGTWFWPFGMAQDIAELIRHARAFAERMDNAESVSFIGEWHGLRGRRPDQPGVPLLRSEGDVAKDDTCVVTKTVGVTDLINGWQTLTADLLSRVLRVFNPRSSVSRQQIGDWADQFRR